MISTGVSVWPCCARVSAAKVQECLQREYRAPQHSTVRRYVTTRRAADAINTDGHCYTVGTCDVVTILHQSAGQQLFHTIWYTASHYHSAPSRCSRYPFIPLHYTHVLFDLNNVNRNRADDESYTTHSDNTFYRTFLLWALTRTSTFIYIHYTVIWKHVYWSYRKARQYLTNRKSRLYSQPCLGKVY